MPKNLKQIAGTFLPDRYTCNARLYPSLMVLAPAVLATVAIAKPDLSWLHSLWIGAGTAGALYWLSQLARDPGKTLESGLWQMWGGAPSVVILRHRDSRIDPITKMRYHAQLVELVPDTSAPTSESEKINPADADACYSAWSTYLRTGTRDQKRFPLIFDELASYGYRRNLLGIRPYGLTSSFLAWVACAIFIAVAIHQKHQVSGALWVALAGDTLLLMFWLFRVSPVWVRLTADHYAARLVEAVDDLHRHHSKSPVKTVAKPKKPRVRSAGGES